MAANIPPPALTVRVDAQGRVLAVTRRDGTRVAYTTVVRDGDDDDAAKLSEEQFPLANCAGTSRRHRRRLLDAVAVPAPAPAPAPARGYTCAWCSHTETLTHHAATGAPLMYECAGCTGHYLCTNPLCRAEDWEQRHQFVCARKH